jgi:two-component system cell cycle response regulator DivK
LRKYLILENEGYEVIGVDNAAEGIHVATECHPDVILMDVQLPGMDGLAATRILKDQPATCRIPVIALTAFAMEGDPTKVRAAGCDAYLAMPFRRVSLLAVVARACSSSDDPQCG